MSNDTLNSLRKQLTFEFMLDFTVELTSEEVALLTLFENLDYSGFGTRLGRKEKVEPFRMMILLIHGAMNNRTSSRLHMCFIVTPPPIASMMPAAASCQRFHPADWLPLR